MVRKRQAVKGLAVVSIISLGIAAFIDFQAFRAGLNPLNFLSLTATIGRAAYTFATSTTSNLLITLLIGGILVGAPLVSQLEKRTRVTRVEKQR